MAVLLLLLLFTISQCIGVSSVVITVDSHKNAFADIVANFISTTYLDVDTVVRLQGLYGLHY